MNNLYDTLQNNPKINITLSAGELIEMVDYCVLKTRKELEQQITDANTETYPSREKVAEILDVDLSTLWAWNKSGYFKCIKLGGKVRYRMSDVKRLLEERK
ncbi:MAG: helix-turn-helix domain-containing protein [Prevotellaceae bacterium]|nr:helix-turn-helix domain-containing protein [Prevotellaceae bacterium]